MSRCNLVTSWATTVFEVQLLPRRRMITVTRSSREKIADKHFCPRCFLAPVLTEAAPFVKTSKALILFTANGRNGQNSRSETMSATTRVFLRKCLVLAGHAPVKARLRASYLTRSAHAVLASLWRTSDFPTDANTLELDHPDISVSCTRQRCSNTSERSSAATEAKLKPQLVEAVVRNTGHAS